MTELIYTTDSYITELEANVVEIREEGVILDKTIAYPQGGGQPSDKAKFILDGNEIPITKIRKVGSEVLHTIDGTVNMGDKLILRIDWDYRLKLIRHHTALHVLSAIVWDKYKAKVTGGTIYHNKARLDFDMMEFNREIAQNIIDDVNEVLKTDHKVEVSFITREELESHPELIRTKVSLIPESVKTIRLVKIGDIDIQADGGLHVRSTREIGTMGLQSVSNKGKGRKRIIIELSD